jgi:hypothetical protein
MTALRNICGELLQQFRLKGGLLARLYCVLAYYAFYVRGRRRGLTQEQSRVEALQALSRRGISRGACGSAIRPA